MTSLSHTQQAAVALLQLSSDVSPQHAPIVPRMSGNFKRTRTGVGPVQFNSHFTRTFQGPRARHYGSLPNQRGSLRHNQGRIRNGRRMGQYGFSTSVPKPEIGSTLYERTVLYGA